MRRTNTIRLIGLAAAFVSLQGSAATGVPSTPPSGALARKDALSSATPLVSNYSPVVIAEKLRPSYSSIGLGAAAPSDLVGSSEDDAVISEQDLWARIRLNYAMQDLDSPVVDKQIAFYANRPQIIERTSLRGSKYLYHVVEELERRHMPSELALLPFVESSFNPNAVSSAKASGLWQFIPSTAEMFRLKLNLFKDDRRDIIASTDAALTYLERLHDMFGDWQLALAAYNWGDGAVRKAIQKNRAAGLGTDYASLAPLMPLETRNYVPRLQAVKAIIAEPERYGVRLPAVDNEPYFTQVSKVPKIEIKTAAHLANMSVTEFRALNPQFNSTVITGRDAKILVPTEKAAAFKNNLQLWGRQVTAWTVHKVQSAREGVEAIAKRFGSTPEAIREANRIPTKMQVLAGSSVLVPQISSIGPSVSDEFAEDAKLYLAAEREPKKTGRHKSRYRQKADSRH
jgi:membrane-bound lytic murein transglycosylase D